MRHSRRSEPEGTSVRVLGATRFQNCRRHARRQRPREAGHFSRQACDMRTARKTIDQYIAGFPQDVQQILQKIRATIREAAPDAQETISYRIPTFKLNGRPLIYFAGFKAHIGLYPITAPIKVNFKKELSGYKGGKGTVRLPLKEPIPYALISRIVKFKVQNSARG